MCPECGREHRSLRAMRRTRRRWGVAVLGVLVLVGAHGVRAVPRVQKEGWGAAMPRIGLVLLLPFLSEEQGSGLSSPVLSPRASNASGLDRFVLGQVPNYGLFYGPSSEVDTGLGWLSRRLVFLFARFQDPDVITDGTTAKGVVTKSLVSQLVHGGKCYRFEADWAKRQATSRSTSRVISGLTRPRWERCGFAVCCLAFTESGLGRRAACTAAGRPQSCA